MFQGGPEPASRHLTSRIWNFRGGQKSQGSLHVLFVVTDIGSRHSLLLVLGAPGHPCSPVKLQDLSGGGGSSFSTTTTPPGRGGSSVSVRPSPGEPLVAHWGGQEDSREGSLRLPLELICFPQPILPDGLWFPLTRRCSALPTKGGSSPQPPPPDRGS